MGMSILGMSKWGGGGGGMITKFKHFTSKFELNH